MASVDAYNELVATHTSLVTLLARVSGGVRVEAGRLEGVLRPEHGPVRFSRWCRACIVIGVRP